jgi:hypothetical protein
MSSDLPASAGVGADDDDVPPDREEVLDLLDDAIREAHRKVESGRVTDAENEKVRVQWVRALGYLAGQYRQLMKDKELEEMQEEIELLKEATGMNHDE